ncbi:cadherin-like beta sandwich domain-containing protein [Mucilaginibacter sp.]|uniref:cadherin-like beta sandwich domain-containing protein n=1 Tax=Mucilaginibacter sp. TaxID=1882438 RepID=UPI0026204FC6|nr:cadherin-like beta sandwich domain-containing protein [Mucilaginibacter sp.]
MKTTVPLLLLRHLFKAMPGIGKTMPVIFAAVFGFCVNVSAGIKPGNKTSSVATLNSLTFDPSITKNTVSGPDFRDYIATVPNAVSSIKVFAITTDPAASVKINGVTIPTGGSSAAIFLGVGDNKIVTTVTATDGITANTYSVVITRLQSTISTLNSLTFNPAITTTVVPGPDYKDYTSIVSSPVTSVKVTPLATDPAANVKVNGVTVAYGAASATIPLNVGVNTIATVITAPDGVTTKTYKTTITRDAPPLLSSLSFDPSITKTTVAGSHFKDYTATVPNSVTSIKVIPITENPSSSVKVNGVAVTSGASSAAIPLNIGNNTITSVVTESDGVTKNTYSIVITRQLSAIATLNSLSLNPAITKTTVTGPDFRDYTASVVNTITSIKVIPVKTDAGSTIKVNGATVASGVSSASIPLIVGNNTITTVVTAADGVTSKTYKIVINRPPSNNATLNELSFSPHDKVTPRIPVSGPGFRNYTATTKFADSIIKVLAIVQESTATIKVNGVVVASHAFSQGIHLNVGPNTINVTVTAGDGIKTQSYITTITRGTIETLNYLTFRPDIQPFQIPGPDYEDYLATVPNSQSTVSVYFIATDPLSTVKVNGVLVKSKVQSAPIPLAVGVTDVSVVVTSRYGYNSKTYKTKITRTGPGSHALAYVDDKADPVLDNTVLVHPSLSPNGDGIGDKLLIDGIAGHPDNELTIMNRSGGLVYEASGYDNVLKVFDGHSSVNGKLQQAGTYFYSLDYKADGQSKRKTGYFIIKY